MSETTEWYEYGYRLEDGTEEWRVDHDPDGSWTPYNSEHNIEAVDMYDGTEVKSIYSALDRAGVAGVAIRKLVTRVEGEPETVARP